MLKQKWQCALLSLLFLQLFFLTNSGYAADSVAVENAKSGTTDWQLANEVCDYPLNCSRAEIEGYASRTSVNQGEQIDFFVSTSVATQYTLKIFRIGWYQGLGGRLFAGPVSLSGYPQAVPAPDATGMIECNWPTAYSLVVPTAWTSGTYLVKLETQAGKQNYIVFVVRDDSRPSPYLFKSSVATAAAYNDWGGRSLYTGFPPHHDAHRVSFNRPYTSIHTASHDRQPGGGTGLFLLMEVNMVRWMERQGYDVTYITDVDLHENPDIAIGHKALLIVGHSEYWSWPMRAHVERARESGVSLGFYCGNSVYWQIRFEPSSTGDPDRTVVGYKEDAPTLDPILTDTDPYNDRYTTFFWSNVESFKSYAPGMDSVNRPEEALIGLGSVNQTNPSSTNGDITVTDPATWPSWLSTGTGLSTGSPLPNILGYETDGLYGYEPVGTVQVGHSLFPKVPVPPDPQVLSDAAVYTAPSGAFVFAAGSINWDRGLDGYSSFPPLFPSGEVPAVQQMTANFLSQALTVLPVASSARLPATVTTSAAAAGYPASNAGDGSSATQWVASLTVSNSNNNAWIRLDFGSRRWIQRVKWLAASGTPYPAYAPTDYIIQISDDAAHWQTVVTKSGTYVFNGDELVNQQARYLQLVTTKVADGTGWSLSFFEFWAEGSAPPPSARLRTFSGYGRSLAGGAGFAVFPDNNAVDQNTSTQWVSSTSPNYLNNFGWYYVDLGNRKQIDRVKWIGATGTPYPSASPTVYSIFVSDDATNWTDVLDRSNTSQVVNGNEPMSTQGRYVGLATSQVSDGTGWGLSFFEFWAEGSDSDNVLAAKVTGSSEAPGYPASNAADGQNSTQWVANLNVDFFHNNNAWIQLDFGSRKQIDRVRWRGASGTPYPAYSPTDYSFQVSDDGVNWTTVSTRTNASAVINGDEFINGTGRYLRLVTTQVADGTGWSLSFFEFWAEGY